MDFGQIKENWKNLPRSYKDKHIYCDICRQVRPRRGKRTVKLINGDTVMCCKRCLLTKKIISYIKRLKTKIDDRELLIQLGIFKERKQRTRHARENIDEVILKSDMQGPFKIGPKLKKFFEEKKKKK